MFNRITCIVVQVLSAIHLERSEEFRIQQFNRSVRKKRYNYTFIFQTVLVILINQEIKVGLHEMFKT